MAVLKEFWYSDGYQEAKKLREGLSKVNFIVAVEGTPIVDSTSPNGNIVAFGSTFSWPAGGV